ncbi:MAG: hypothetical protein M3Z26_08925 [Bacteroidota bacterium]|nr:hypothetical protein [Bacteroidota bacterium]
MNFKHAFFVITFTAINLVMVSCSNNSSGTENNSDKAKTATITDTFVSNKKLPKGASRLDNLPANVKGFVQKNYPGYIITIAVLDPLCGDGDAVDVAITKIGSPDLSLIFKPDGTFVQQEQDVPLNTVSRAIRQTLKFKYADYTAGVQIEKLTLADNTEEYLVDLSKGAKSKEVILDTKGLVVCEN